MKTILSFLILTILSYLCHSETVASAPSGRFHIEQTYAEPWSEKVVFNREKSPVPLAGYIWPGIYSISPDEKWILRIQKIGSGENIAILYQVEKSGRIMEVLNFDELLWSTADKTLPIKRNDLYHTGVLTSKWAKDSSSLMFTLKGKNEGEMIEKNLRYNVKTHTFTLVDQ